MDAARSPIEELADAARSAARLRMRAEFDHGPTKRLRTSVSSGATGGTAHWSLSMDVVSTQKRWGDPAELDKAMSMLRADRFQLFARVAEDHLVGVVRNQSEASIPEDFYAM